MIIDTIKSIVFLKMGMEKFFDGKTTKFYDHFHDEITLKLYDAFL